MAGDRLEDAAAVLAYHYSTALDLERAVGRAADAGVLEPPAFRFLSLAGERALGLDVTVAVQLLEQALALAPPGHAERGAALARYGQAMYHDGRFKEAATAFEEAIAIERAAQDVAAAAQIMGTYASCLRIFGDPRARSVAEEAVALLDPLGPSPRSAEAIARVASQDAVAGRPDIAIQGLRRALDVAASAPFAREAEGLGFRGDVLGFMGLARTDRGDAGGLDDMREAIRLATAAGQGIRAAIHYNNLAAQLASFEGTAAALDAIDEALPFAASRGLRGEVTTLKALRLEVLFDAGDHDAILEEAPDIEALLDKQGIVIPFLVELRATVTRIETIRGEETNPARLAWIETTARESGDLDTLVAGLGATAPAWLRPDPARARAQVAELVMTRGDGAPWWFPRLMPALVRTLLGVDDVTLAETIIDAFVPIYPYAEHAHHSAVAALLEAKGDLPTAAVAYEEAAERWRFGAVPERAYALLGLSRTLRGLDRPGEAEEVEAEATRLFQRLGASSPVEGELPRSVR
jgi:tetratricopeptide (TPR) repeat protein